MTFCIDAKKNPDRIIKIIWCWFCHCSSSILFTIFSASLQQKSTSATEDKLYSLRVKIALFLSHPKCGAQCLYALREVKSINGFDSGFIMDNMKN